MNLYSLDHHFARDDRGMQAHLHLQERSTRPFVEDAQPCVLSVLDALAPEQAAAGLLTLALAVEARDPHGAGHCDRLARRAVGLGEMLGLADRELWALALGARLHDIGMISVPDVVLLKPGRLTDAEYELVKQHTLAGERLCSGPAIPRAVRDIVCQHHERLDGTGYPHGLCADEISLLAQIVGVVDTFEAMTMRRAYRAALPVDLALQSLCHGASRGAVRRTLVDALESTLLTEGVRSVASRSRCL